MGDISPCPMSEGEGGEGGVGGAGLSTLLGGVRVGVRVAGNESLPPVAYGLAAGRWSLGAR